MEVVDGSLQSYSNSKPGLEPVLLATSRFISETAEDFEGSSQLEIRVRDDDLQRCLDGHMLSCHCVSHATLICKMKLRLRLSMQLMGCMCFPSQIREYSFGLMNAGKYCQTRTQRLSSHFLTLKWLANLRTHVDRPLSCL
jgi:hypothetical protein